MLQPWLEYVGSWQRGATLGFSGKVWKDLCGLPNLFGYRDLDFDLDLRRNNWRNQTTSVRCTIPVSLSSWLVRCHFDMMVLLANLGQACGSSDASFKASRINPTYRHCILGAQYAVTIKITISWHHPIFDWAEYSFPMYHMFSTPVSKDILNQRLVVLKALLDSWLRRKHFK